VLSGALAISDEMTISLKAIDGVKIRVNRAGWEDYKLADGREVLEIVAIGGKIYLFKRPRPAKYERIDHDDIHEAGYRPDDFE
jgi:hypothetical protein